MRPARFFTPIAIIGVKALQRFPFIWHSIVIPVRFRCSSLKVGPTTD